MRWFWIFLGWAEYTRRNLGYRIRPYDVIADRRRWFWQPRTLCQFSRRQNLGR